MNTAAQPQQQQEKADDDDADAIYTYSLDSAKPRV